MKEYEKAVDRRTTTDTFRELFVGSKAERTESKKEEILLDRVNLAIRQRWHSQGKLMGLR